MRLLKERMDVSRSENGYIIKSARNYDTDAEWWLLVENTSDLFEIVRRKWGPRKTDIAQELFNRGIPFRTLSSKCSLLPNEYLAPEATICPVGYEHTLNDYHVYEARRDAFLRTRRGRAALMKGGIIWRLAIEVLGWEHIVYGPGDRTDFAFSTTCDDVVLVDDELSDAELDLICGVDLVPTGKTTRLCRE